MLDAQASNQPENASDDSAAAPRRRRAASRPAGPPLPVVAEQPPAAPPVPPEAPQPAPEPVSAAGEPSAEPPKRRPRRKASDDAEPEAKPARRRSRKAAEEAPAVPEISLDQLPGLEVPPPAKPARASRAKKAKAAEPEAAPTADDQAKVEAFGLVAESPDAVLESLAAAIGGGEASPSAGDETAEASDEDEPKRRRRRGGRRRRKGEDADEAGQEADEAGDTDKSGQAADGSEEEHAETGSTRRRRRRRRRGEDVGESDDDAGAEVVVRVREPRRTRTTAEVAEEVVSIEGSTRIEAKKQRRREGRAAGRRRAPVLSESEFLARRESVDRKMVIRQAEDYSQIAVLEDGMLVEHYVDRASATSMIGNIYLGRVQNVLPSMEAAFIDIGRGRNAVLYAGEVDWDSFGEAGQDKKVEDVFKSGQHVLVQVSKDPVGAKGARLTSHISIPGRYIVYSPGGQLSGISRKLPEAERRRLKDLLDKHIEPQASVIVRTAAEGASEDELVHDVNRLKAQWEVIAKKAEAGQAPKLLYSEPDLTVRIVRDLFTEDFKSLVVDSAGYANDAYETVEAYVQHVAPHLADRVEKWDRQAKGDLFDSFRIQEQIAKALERKVFLPSGGSLIIDRTEAMTVVDVNTGKFTGSQGNLEATVTANNLEAAEEIVRQLRLRDIGGIIVIDFIDMVLPSNRELLLRRLVECLGRDRTRHQVAEVTSLGLVQMTRKKIGTGLAEAFTVPCETCDGRGYHTHDMPVPSQAPADGGERDGKSRKGGGAKRKYAKKKSD
ncbi:MAG: Rne/Rng family ribonuclease [Propionibacteriaceae bacterium]|jgi:ribonuclease E|nr:Rne/Rng family ribonuclease [Propionibacteriaceae bacterium]